MNVIIQQNVNLNKTGDEIFLIHHLFVPDINTARITRYSLENIWEDH